ncbi:MAG TPA: hypothetical protein VGG39_24650 [Polyangiaceae bacterium]|jgi:hypothetical protein
MARSNIPWMPSKTAALAVLKAVVAGLQKHYPGGSFTLRNVTYTTDEIVALFEELVAAILAVNAAQAAAADAVEGLRAVQAKVAPVFVALRQQLRMTFGTAVQMLWDFGLTPAKERTPPTTEQLVAATAKAAATREARGTRSKKANAAIFGNVTGVTVAPVTVKPTPARKPPES